MKHKIIILTTFILFAITCIMANRRGHVIKLTNTTSTSPIPESKFYIYDSLGLAELGLSRVAFEKALKGYHILLSSGKIQHENIISIIDFSLSSNKKRLFVIDIDRDSLIYNTYVAHGKKSGMMLPTKFSNKPESRKSSLGFFITGDTYSGKKGYSLRLLGAEKGINDNAFKRGIVMHSATYVDEDIIESQGFIGRSYGCPALPANIYKDVIETIKQGSCLFIYSPDIYYAKHSRIMHNNKS